MLNKYIEHLVTGTNAKVYRLQKHGNESGFLSLGNLVCPLDSESQNTHTLKAMAFSAIVDELNLQYDDHELIKYVRGQSELNQNETFNATKCSWVNTQRKARCDVYNNGVNDHVD